MNATTFANELTLEDLRGWSIVHTMGRSYIGQEDKCRPINGGFVLLNAFEYHVNRRIDTERGGVQVMVLVLPVETLGPLEVRINDTAATVVRLKDAPESTLRVLYARVMAAMQSNGREAAPGAPRIVLPGVPGV